MQRSVWRAGDWITAVSGGALLVSLFLPWYGVFTGIVCVRAPCPTFFAASGWKALGGEGVLLATSAAVGLALPLVALVKAQPALVRVAIFLTTGAGVLALAIVVLRLNAPPAGLGDVVASALPLRAEADVRPWIGAYLALVGSVGLCGGAGLSLATRTTGRLSPLARDPARLLPAAAGFGLLVSLFLPWFQVEIIRALSLRARAPRSSYNAWEAFLFSDVLLAAIALGIVAGSLVAVLANAPRLYLPIALLGLLALVGALFSATRPAIPVASMQIAPDVGLVAAALASGTTIIGAVWAALVEPSPQSAGQSSTK